MTLDHPSRTAALALLPALLLCASTALAEEGDALIRHNLGLAETARGNDGAAYDLFKDACMAPDAVAEACMEWGRLATARGNDKDVKRAYGSAVMLAPEDIRARYELAMMLLEKEDWVWAIEHLSAAVPNAGTPEDGALLRYYLGYAELKSGDASSASKHLAQATRRLPPELAQKARFYRGLAARQLAQQEKAVAMMREAEAGPDAGVAEAARGTVKSWTAFGRMEGWGGQVMASLGYNSHPLSGFLDDPGAETTPVLQSELRGDLVVGSRTGYTHGFLGGVTAYRQQAWAELGDRDPSQIEAGEMNFTMLMFQGSYVGRAWKLGLEHELRLGIDADLQFLDTKPVYDELNQQYRASDVPLAVLARTIGGRIQWSMAKDPGSIWGLRLKLDVLDNAITPDMSAFRIQLRAFNTTSFLDRKLQLKTMLSGRYDRTFRDPAVVKYDRLRPELWIDLKWITPWPRLAAMLGGKLAYNWYMSSHGEPDHPENSFRPAWADPVWPDGDDDDNLPDPVFSDAENLRYEDAYYDLKRHDFEWEISLEADLALWKAATLALRYQHRQRLSNIDDAPLPVTYDAGTGLYSEAAGTQYGYDQDLVMLMLTQAF
jgi:hypothetical protein